MHPISPRSLFLGAILIAVLSLPLFGGEKADAAPDPLLAWWKTARSRIERILAAFEGEELAVRRGHEQARTGRQRIQVSGRFVQNQYGSSFEQGPGDG